MNKILAILLLLATALLVYTMATMPDPYRYGQCPEGYKVKKVVTTCDPVP